MDAPPRLPFDADPLATGSEPESFNGPAYDPVFDDARLGAQLHRVYALMADAQWRTLAEIAARTGDPPASVSAQLRHLRKDRFGRHTVERQVRGERSSGLWEYRLLVNEATDDTAD